MSDSPPVPSAAGRDFSLRRLASRASLAVAVILVAVKLAAWIVTGSVALLASAVDGLVDAAAAFATFFGVRYAERPPDREHRFGHGKGEAVAGFTQAVFLVGAALTLAFQSAERLVFPEPIKQLGLGFVGHCPQLARRHRPRHFANLGSAGNRLNRNRGGPGALLTDVALNLAVLAALGVTPVHWLGSR